MTEDRKEESENLRDLTKSIRPFIENIDTVNRLNNDSVQLLIDKDNLYIRVQSEE